MRASRILPLFAVVSTLVACSGGGSGTTGGATGEIAASTTGTQGAGTTGVASTSGTVATGTSSSTSGTAGTGGSYDPFDGGPHSVTLPNAAAADAGCTIGFPILSDAGFCTQCLSDTDCPAPTVCETNPTANYEGRCVQCSVAEPTCPAGQICDLGNSDLCVPNCSNGTSCVTPLGGYCNLDAGDGQIGCVVGCRTNADCPASDANCDPTSGLCGPCVELTTPSGCPSGELCGYTVDEVPACVPDCRLDAGICLPGVCDADAGSGSIQCLSDVCVTDADCAVGNLPHCNSGSCSQCAADSDCQALGFGEPICSGGACGISCTADPTGCGSEQCVYIDGGGGDLCVCASDQDCAGQASAPSCLPLIPDAGLDAGAGLYGQCGCTLGNCPTGTVCEPRFDVLELVTSNANQPLCVPNCGAGPGQLDCASDFDFNDVCNPTTGYCVSCFQDSQCSVDGGEPVCVPQDGGLPTGGGLCGCTATSCGSGDVCDPSLGYCHPGCSYSSDGYDTCLDQSVTSTSELCNSETGLCQQCFVDADCAGQQSFTVSGSYPAAFCSDAGVCYGCNTAADCPTNLPGCFNGVCGACGTSADCVTGNTCAPWGTCQPSCTPTGGQCAALPANPICDQTFCVQCLTSSDCDAGFEECEQGSCVFAE